MRGRRRGRRTGRSCRRRTARVLRRAGPPWVSASALRRNHCRALGWRPMTSVLATGADERYGWWLLNLLGSIHANSRGVFDRIVAYDLGLDPLQRRLPDGVPGVEVRAAPPFAPHWRQGFTWKPWIWAHVDAGEDVFWIDAGTTVLRS